MASFMTPSPREMAELLSERDTLLRERDETITKLAAEAEKRYAAEDARNELLAAAKVIASFAVAWQPLSPGDIRALTDAIAKAEGQ